MNISYLEELCKISRENIAMIKKFDYSDFYTVNTYLVQKSLLKNLNLFINVNKRDVNILLHPVVFESLRNFFKTNYADINKTHPKVGEKYHKGKKRYKVVETGFFAPYFKEIKAVKLECISRGQNDIVVVDLNDFRDEYTKVDDDSGSSNRETFEPMIDLVKHIIGVKYLFSSFNNKFAIVCSKKDFEDIFTAKERRAFPYEYITKNEKTHPNLPLEDFMFYIAPDYETIQYYVIDNKGIKLDLLLFFGNKEELQIQQDINREFIKQVIFIGNQKPDISSLLKWRWTLPELQYFNERTKTVVNPVVVKNEELNKSTLKFLNCIKDIEDKHGIDLSAVYWYISYLYPIVILSEDSRLGNRLEVLSCYFEKTVKQVLIENFSVIGVDHTEIYTELLNIYRDALFQVNFVNNVKTTQLRILEETEYLLIPSGQTLEVWKYEIRKINWQKVKVISLSKFRELTKQSSVTVLELKDKEFFQEVYSGMHKIQWLLYDNEYKNYKNFEAKYDNELIEELSSKDRKILSGINYPKESKVESTESLIDRIYDGDISEIGREYELSYHDHISKEIIFFDNTSITLPANSSVILVNKNNKLINNRVGDLRPGDKVRIYENQHKDVLLDSIIQSDKHGKFQIILEDSEKWKAVVRGYCTNDIKVEEIALRCDIAPSTVNGWLKSSSSTKFPQNIDKIKDLLGKYYPQICKSSKNYKSITIAVGRNLSYEISDYIINKHKGSLLSKLDNDIIDLISQSNMPERKIKNIEIVESEDS